MPSGTYNGFMIEKGADFTPGSITWKDANDTAIDLTGYTARMDIKKDSDSSSILNLTTENNRISLGGIAGTISLSVAATDTDPLIAGTYNYDLELVSGSSVITRLLEGTISVTENITT
jgi:hypothetical protein